jgi:hypothetical protein
MGSFDLLWAALPVGALCLSLLSDNCRVNNTEDCSQSALSGVVTGSIWEWRAEQLGDTGCLLISLPPEFILRCNVEGGGKNPYGQMDF